MGIVSIVGIVFGRSKKNECSVYCYTAVVYDNATIKSRGFMQFIQFVKDKCWVQMVSLADD